MDINKKKMHEIISFLYFFKAMPFTFRVGLIVGSLSKAKVVLFGLTISL